jgi:hypothetical protein
MITICANPVTPNETKSNLLLEARKRGQRISRAKAKSAEHIIVAQIMSIIATFRRVFRGSTRIKANYGESNRIKLSGGMAPPKLALPVANEAGGIRPSQSQSNHAR